MATIRSPAFDPWQAEQAGVWRNRLAEMRESPAEPAFHAVVYLVLAGMLVPVVVTALRNNADAINGLLLEWRWLALTALLCLLLYWQLRSLRKRVSAQKNGWLAAQPIQSGVWLWNARRHLAWLGILQITLTLALGWSIRAPMATVLTALAGALVSALLLAVSPTRFVSGLRKIDLPVAVIDSAPGPGRIWRWQRIEARAIFGPKRFSSLLMLLLVIPSGSPLRALLLSVLALLTVALLAAAWQSSLQVLPVAQRCFAVQPIRARRLLAAWVLLPLAIIGASIAVVALVLSSTGAVKLVTPAVLAILALAGLGMACVAAERRNPRRIGMVFSLHLMVLLAVVQALPPIAVLLWPAQMVWLVRRGLIT